MRAMKSLTRRQFVNPAVAVSSLPLLVAAWMHGRAGGGNSITPC